jgi:hypothetical protein
MVFLSPGMLAIMDAGYASLICDQLDFQASEATLKVTCLCPLSSIITGSNSTLGTALAALPVLTVFNYLYCSIKSTTPSYHLAYLFCFCCQLTSYTASLIISTFPTLALLYPIKQSTTILETPRNPLTTETITELLAQSISHLLSVNSFNPYDNAHICPTSTPDSDHPSQQNKKSKQHLNKTTHHLGLQSPSVPSHPVAGLRATVPNPATILSTMSSLSTTTTVPPDTTPKCSTTFKPRLLQSLFVSTQFLFHSIP